VRIGSVALVGAGPGDPRLITVRGLALLRRADVVVYDRLVDRRLLREAPRARQIFAGKASGDHALPQPDINALLVRHARDGCRVVRLKGGDPFVFGRGGEEAAALVQAGIPFEVVPGVSAAVAVPAYAGIPVTHRGLATSFAVVTGHEACEDARVDWRRLATAVDTLVILMGASALPRIAERLIAHGRAASTPAAVVRWGATPRQSTLVDRLDRIASRAAGVEPPAVIVIGHVVALRERLAWFERRPRRRADQSRSVIRRLPPPSTAAVQPGGSTSVESYASMMAGPSSLATDSRGRTGVSTGAASRAKTTGRRPAGARRAATPSARKSRRLLRTPVATRRKLTSSSGSSVA
jgi:uroporphyrinogen III methyltransferase / synthase